MKKILKYLEIRFEKHKKKWDTVIAVDGDVGCLSGDTEIQISRRKISRRYTIKGLYNRYKGNPQKERWLHKDFNVNFPVYVRSYNGKDIRLNQMLDIFYSGIKQTYLLELDNGKNIKSTKEHKFLTRDGWKELQNLCIGEEIMCDNFSQGEPLFIKVKSITPHKLEDVYDLQCKDPNNNFIANGIIVHNSGKSNLGLHMLEKWMILKNGKCLASDIKHMGLTKKLFLTDLSTNDANGASVYDEAGELTSRRAMAKFNTNLMVGYRVIRADQILTILILDDFFDLDPYFRKKRVKGLFHIDARGKISFWSKRRLRALLAANSGRDMKSYDLVAPTFRDVYPEYNGVMREAYDKLKAEKTRSSRLELKKLADEEDDFIEEKSEAEVVVEDEEDYIEKLFSPKYKKLY